MREKMQRTAAGGAMLRRWVADRLERRQASLLGAIASVAGALWVFVELADEVLEGETRSIDEAILFAFRAADDLSDPLGPHWVEELGRDFTALGSVGVLVTVVLMVTGFLFFERKHRAAIVVVVGVGLGQIMSSALKIVFERPRPDLVPHETYVYTASFPSGHAMMSAVTYLTLGALLARLETRPATKVYVLAVAGVLTIAVGVSRVYLGVHWPTDVLAGWTIGAAWALLWWAMVYALQMRGKVENPDRLSQEAEEMDGR